jgi:hypothetical protein
VTVWQFGKQEGCQKAWNVVPAGSGSSSFQNICPWDDNIVLFGFKIGWDITRVFLTDDFAAGLFRQWWRQQPDIVGPSCLLSHFSSLTDLKKQFV